MGKKKNKPAGKARAGRQEAAGATFRPADLPEQEAPTGAPEPGAVPLGLPISAEDYEALREQARHRTVPPRDCAQEDSSG